MKRASDKELLPEYDFSHGVRGKYVSRIARGSNVVVLDRDVQKMFPDSAAVNAALRALGKAVEVVRQQPGPIRRPVRSRTRVARTG